MHDFSENKGEIKHVPLDKRKSQEIEDVPKSDIDLNGPSVCDISDQKKSGVSEKRTLLYRLPMPVCTTNPCKAAF